VPRPRSIPQHKRVSVFLAYRLGGGKVLPVAKSFGIARSTVTSIVKEFKDLGFSEKPRAKLSMDFLVDMQDEHVRAITAHREVGPPALGSGTGNEKGRQDAMANPLPVDPDFHWHVKGTRAEQVISDETAAIHDYLSRESDTYRDLRQTLEGLCGLKERDSSPGDDPEPHLLPALAGRLHSAFFELAFQSVPPSENWLDWDTVHDQPRSLRLHREVVAVGTPEDHHRTKRGGGEFLVKSFQVFQRRFSELNRLRSDLQLAYEIVAKVCRSIEESDIRRGMCPGCPYPEAMIDAEWDNQ
jgi:hypothetical protein